MRNIKIINNKLSGQGFTLIEVMVVLAIISIIAVMSLSSWQSFSDSAALGDTAKMIEAKIKLAKSYSLSALNDTNYGVHLKSDSITIFPGAAYVDGDPTNQVFALTDGVEVYDGVGNSILFSRLTGVTADFGTIGVRMINRPSKTKIITINAQGQTGTDSFEASAVPPIVEDTANNINARHIHFYLAWSIQTYDTLRLEWTGADVATPVTKDVDITTGGYFNADQSSFDWQGTESVDSASQTLRIHTISLDASTTLLCIIRDRMTNNKSLNIYFLQGATTKKIVNYTENGGIVAVTPDILYVSSMDAQ